MSNKVRNPTKVFAHRGGNLSWPGNTIVAFDEALKLVGCDWLEMDVRCTMDGVLVMMHNPTIENATGKSLFIADHKLEDLQQLDAAYWWGPPNYPYRGKGVKIPTLEQVFERYKDRDVPMNIEIKQIMPSIVDRFCDLVLNYENYGIPNRILVASFSTSVLRQVRTRLPHVATSAATWEMVVFYLLNWINRTDKYHLPVQALQYWSSIGPFPIITESLVAAAHRYGMEIHGWTVNRKEEMNRLIQLGVDGIITDDPILLIDQLKLNPK